MTAPWKPTRREILAVGTAALLTGCTPDSPVPPVPTPAMTAAGRVPLPPDLLLGLSTSAYQIEGSVSADGRGPSIWDTFCNRKGVIVDASSGATACDHYQRWSEDLDLMASLGIQSYRFSVAWTRVLPEGRGAVNQRGLDFYKRLVEGLLDRNISPLVTLYHWDLPQALQDLGGWQVRDSASWFADYASVVFEELVGVRRWLTINEPRVVVHNGHLNGQHAPGIADERAAGRVLHHLSLAHGRAVQAFRSSSASGVIGPCHVLSPCYPADDSPSAVSAAALEDAELNTLYLDPVLKGEYPELTEKLPPRVQRSIESAQRNGDLRIISEPVDLVGINYYTPVVINGRGERQKYFPLTPIDWPMYPGGLTECLLRIHREYGAPLIAVTENGVGGRADEALDDSFRTRFLRDHLLALKTAVDDGARLESYNAWSLMDNFEWAQGYSQRWGLVNVDFKTQHRKPKASARWYADVLGRRSVPLQG
ncbi:MAG TPA: GH1 family beta-glucosidase [Microlunatus sp.]